MTTDFSKYKTVINKLRGEVGKSAFEKKFIATTKQLSKKEQFLLKMELKRLGNICTRSIDLRGLVDGNCKVYEHQGQSHFLDDVAIRVFEKNVAIYGNYTFGVYEAVKNTENNFRVIYKNEQAGLKATAPKPIKKNLEKTQYPANLYQFNHYFDRCEERMNFAITLTLTLENKKQIQASSSDVSAWGCKFRLVKQQILAVGDIVHIKFTGLEEEFQFGSTDVFTYRIKNSHQDAGTQLLGCQRIEVPEQDAFQRFLRDYIQGNKRRYKVNLDNSIQALQSRGFEQFLLPKLSELPVFLTQEAAKLVPRYVLTTNNNQPVYQYWQDEVGQSTLSSLLNEERLARLLLQSKHNKSLIVYSFIHQHQGKSFFYTLDELQVDKKDKFHLDFLAFAAKKASFAITQLSCVDVAKDSAYSPFTLSNTRELKYQYINLPPSPEVLECLTVLPKIVTLCDITHADVVKQYQQLTANKIDTSLLKFFGHKRLTKQTPVDEIGISYKNQRQELRFIYNTDAVVECNNVKWHGVSVDFSVSGLQIKLNEGALLSVGDIVKLTFPKLQTITSAFDLKSLPYEVVRINKKKTVVNLRVSVKEHQHIGRAFFKLLIEKNKNKLTPDEYAMVTPGLSEALRTSYAASMTAPALIVQTSGSRYKVETLICNDSDNAMLEQMQRLSERKNFYNLYPLINKLQTDNSLEQSLKALLMNDKPASKQLYIAINTNSDNVESSVELMLESDLDTPELKQFFIKRARNRGEFYCIQLKISRANEPDMEFLNAELSYIGSYAIHRGKQIEQDIWSVAGVIQFFDVTNEVLLINGES